MCAILRACICEVLLQSAKQLSQVLTNVEICLHTLGAVACIEEDTHNNSSIMNIIVN